jgi:carbonic anhydrase
MENYKNLLLANKAWVQERLQIDKDYFKELAKDQKPEYLWVGCSDSRVPAEEITGTKPGDVFAHRNIANLVLHTDINLQSVLHYAVEVLKVNHIIVCGHYGCGGVRAAMTRQKFGILDEWLRNIKDVYHYHREEIESVGDENARVDRLVELNVLEQLRNITKTKVVQKAWHNERRPTVHGWVFNMADGKLKNLYKMEPGSPIEDIYSYDPSTLV